MEDIGQIVWRASSTDKDALVMGLFAVFDGHGGRHAAEYARGHLMKNILNNMEHPLPSEDREVVLKAIQLGFCDTQKQMASESGELCLFSIENGLY